MQGYSKMKNQRSMTPPKEHNNFPVTNHREMEIYKLPDKEFKIIVLKKLSKLQENPDTQKSQENSTWAKWEVEERDSNHKKKLNGNSGAKEFSEWNGKCNNQQQAQSGRRNDLHIQREIMETIQSEEKTKQNKKSEKSENSQWDLLVQKNQFMHLGVPEGEEREKGGKLM